MSAQEYISLSELQSLVKQRLDESFPFPYWVTAEISELKVNYSGHCYLELVEKGGDNQVPRAKANAVIWRSTYGALSAYFSATAGTPLAVGMKVLLRVTVNYHELYGFSLVVSDIDPLYTLGDMERQRQETIRRLQEDGVYDMNRSLEMPLVVQRIAVVSSRNAAGYQDFMKELGASGYAFAVTLFDAFMQGNDAEASIIAALETVAERCEEFDVVVVIRGGGSQSDLACFNSYRLCCHLSQFPLPVITGIGHDKDQSVADLVAAVALKTPTAVAGYLVDRMAEFDAYLDSLQEELLQSSVAVLDAEKRRVRTAGLSLSQTAGQLTRNLEVRLERLSGEIARRRDAALMRRTATLESLDAQLRDRVRTLLERQRVRLEHAVGLTDGRRPERILALGFAIVRSEGRAVKESARLTVGSQIDVTLARGSVTAEVTDVWDGSDMERKR